MCASSSLSLSFLVVLIVVVIVVFGVVVVVFVAVFFVFVVAVVVVVVVLLLLLLRLPRLSFLAFPARVACPAGSSCLDALPSSFRFCFLLHRVHLSLWLLCCLPWIACPEICPTLNYVWGRRG